MAPLSRMEWIEKIDFPNLPFALKLWSKKSFEALARGERRDRLNGHWLHWLPHKEVDLHKHRRLAENFTFTFPIIFVNFSSLPPKRKEAGLHLSNWVPRNTSSRFLFSLVPTEKHGLVFADGNCLFIFITFLFIHKKNSFHLGLN